MTEQNLIDWVAEATFEFTLGNNEVAIQMLEKVIAKDPNYFPAWHALAEVYYSEKLYDKALDIAETAYSLKPNDIHINTSLSRIWLELGDKTKAEHFGSQVRILSWKKQLKNSQD